MKKLHLLAMAVLLAAPLPATAQINPFRSSGRYGAQLSGDDLNLLFASIARLNGTASVQAGASEDWSNPATGSHGTSTVMRVFMSQGIPCHFLHHEIAAQGRTPPRPYDLTWCRATDGTWKIKG